MIYDRPYMRNDYKSPAAPKKLGVLTWIISLTVGVFIIQKIFEVWFKSPAFFHFFALSETSLINGFIWTPLSFGFLHSTLFHILGNLLGAFFLGRAILPFLGERRFLGLYLASIVVSGIVWLLIHIITPGNSHLIGASGGVAALLIVFASFFPERPITILLFFIIPITMKPKYLALGALAISVLGLLFTEIPGTSSIAHSAHLGGMLCGWVYFKYLHQRTSSHSSSGSTMEVPKWFRRKKTSSTTGNFKVNISRPQKVDQATIDSILDKINKKGFGSLTDEEKKTLDAARDILNKR